VTLPAWCTPLADAQRMRAIDRWAIEDMGVGGLELMERAGAAVAAAVEEVAPDGDVAVVCGKGNNGGDGFVVARLLRQRGRDVRVLCTAAASGYTGDAAANLHALGGTGPDVLDDRGDDDPVAARAAASWLGRPAVIVDALLGTGFEGVPRGAVAGAIAAVNAAGAIVVSVDVPSGVDASSGAVGAEAVVADVTVTFHLAKAGLWIAPGKAHAGVVHTVDIGIPRGSLAATASAEDGINVGGAGPLGLVEAAVSDQLPRRSAASTKFSGGHVLVVGGSMGLTGAVRMTSEAAARSGAGYVTACVPAPLHTVVAASMTPEVMVRAVPGDGSNHAETGLQDLLAAATRAGAVALGTGLGRDSAAAALARALAREVERPLVLDADALNAHVGSLETIARRRDATVMTPHAGELGRLLGVSGEVVGRERLASACDVARRAGAIVVLKGDDTLVVDPQGRAVVGRGNSPALATAGTGDVLTGVIAALLAAGLDPFTAAAAGVWMHAQAGRLAASRQGSAEGVLAGDVIAALPAARRPGVER
jgi:NAD(P)H-hydrate epimerase